MAARTGIVEETSPHDRLIVYPSRTRTVLATVGVIAVLLPLGLVTVALGVRDHELVPVVLGPLIIVISLVAGVSGLRTLWSEPQPLLVVDADGLRDPGAGMVRWPDVGEIGITRLKYIKYVVVHIRDPQVLADSGVPRPSLVRSNLRWLGAPIALASPAIPGSCTQLIARIERYRP